MSRLAVLTENEQKEFDFPPILLSDTKALCFNIIKELENKINMLRTPTNKVDFLLQYQQHFYKIPFYVFFFVYFVWH